MSNELTVIQSQGGIVSMAIDSLTTQVLQNADDGVELSVLDVELVESVVKASKSAQGFQRATLYWIRQKKGYFILGYESFEEFGLKEFGLEKSTLHAMANAHHVQTILEKSNMLDSNNDLPIRSTNQLNKLSSAEIPEAYQLANEKAQGDGKKLNTKHVEQAVKELQAKNQSLQNQLEAANANAMQIALKLDAKQGEIAELKGANWKLENQQQQIIEAKLNEERAKLVLENQQAIAENKRLADNAIAELERLKREQQKAIKDGVSRELSNLDREIELKQGQVDSYTKRIETLRNTELSLERSVGVLQTHKKCIEKIKDNLSFLTVSFHDAFDTNEIPAEVSGEWDAIFYAISKLKKQMADWRDQCSPIESEALIGELVD